ncbi:MAG: lytic murein transglycosylase, partial [Rhodospirillaceae bacterium]
EPVLAAPAPFGDWLEDVRLEAARRGISSGTIETALTDLEPIPRVVELDRRQPEFSRTFADYIQIAVSEERVQRGKDVMRRHGGLLADLERQYGVPARFLAAIWGLETNFGQVTGGFPVIGALATLSYDGRRGEFFRRELFNALTIVDQGHISASAMQGSWAGAMGHTQFMPSTFLRHAVDHTGDGRADIWNSVPDALGSAANYLHNLGWNFGYTWGRQVRLPEDFDYSLVSVDAGAMELRLPLSRWAELGVRRVGGGALSAAEISAAVVTPEGAGGAAFLVYDNYNVILDWNRSVFYAIAVGHLADRLVGAPPLVSLATSAKALSRDEVIALQAGLIELGFLSGSADGILGSGTRRAVRAFQKANGLQTDGYADHALAAEVAGQTGAR